APGGAPLLADHLDGAAVNQGLEHLEVSLPDQVGVVVGGRAAEPEVPAGRYPLDDGPGHLGAHPDTVEGHVDGIRMVDGHVVGNGGDAFAGGHLHRGRGRVAVAGDDDDHIHAPGDEVLDLGVLDELVVVGVGEDDVNAQFLRLLRHHVPLAGPALLREAADGDANGDLVI